MQDLICRQAAIDLLKKWSDGYSWLEIETDFAIEEFKQLPSVQRWIPCSERLPNYDEYIKNNGLFIVSDGNRSYSEWYDIYDKRRFGESTMSGFRIDYAVTAWMPLPEPYKEREREK